jgi:hypothetical protein
MAWWVWLVLGSLVLLTCLAVVRSRQQVRRIRSGQVSTATLRSHDTWTSTEGSGYWGDVGAGGGVGGDGGG